MCRNREIPVWMHAKWRLKYDRRNSNESSDSRANE